MSPKGGGDLMNKLIRGFRVGLAGKPTDQIILNKLFRDDIFRQERVTNIQFWNEPRVEQIDAIVSSSKRFWLVQFTVLPTAKTCTKYSRQTKCDILNIVNSRLVFLILHNIITRRVDSPWEIRSVRVSAPCWSWSKLERSNRSLVGKCRRPIPRPTKRQNAGYPDTRTVAKDCKRQNNRCSNKIIRNYFVTTNRIFKSRG